MKLSRRDAVRLLAAAVFASSRTIAMADSTTSVPEFDVTSVKPSRTREGWQAIDTMPGRIHAESITLNRCIREAYDIGPHQLVGGPDWLDSDRWEIEARAGQRVDDDAVLMLMLRKLLADRFRLAVHRETRTLPAYLLEVDKKGTKMQKADPGDSDTELHGGRGGPTTLEAKKTDMDALTVILGWRMDRLVVNRTGLQGSFNFTLHWMADTMRNRDDGEDDVSIFTAVGEQLGLRLRAARAPVEVIVIDHVEQPSPN
ncbi:MAG: TIGR03435 family protein [Acidobacteriota bacterium]|nr:TIGR03435 family protein [Acidobacteriota bacterium]